MADACRARGCLACLIRWMVEAGGSLETSALCYKRHVGQGTPLVGLQSGARAEIAGARGLGE
jgi:hypothetical protein